MTIRFSCPNCDELIAFDDKHIGKRARCISCGQIFIIPSSDDETPQRIEPQIQKAEPLPGFYHAVFVDSWKIFASRANATGLVFVMAVVCFKFFVRHMNYTIVISGAAITLHLPVPFGIVMTIAAWGCLFWYYMKIIYSTAFDIEELPLVQTGGIFGFVWNILKSVYVFFIVLVVLGLPYIITIVISRKTGFEWPVLLHVFMLAGLFLFPMAILTVAVGKDITLLRPDYILTPVFRAFKPYLVVAALFVAAAALEMQTTQYKPELPVLAAVGRLGLNLAVQIIAIIAMRSIGLFYRHYSCYLPW